MSVPPRMVSIVVPARDEASSIERCVRGLLDQTYDAAALEVLVVDGMSEDGTAAIVSAMTDDPRVRLLVNPARVTPEAFNIGLRAARGDILGIMSAHAEPAADYVARAVAALDDTGAWAVGGRIDRVASTAEQRAIAAATSSPFGVGNAVHNYATEPQWVETAFPGMWPRRVFETVGLFDPELVRNQDDELSFRIREAGGRIWYDPALVIRYQPRSTLAGLFTQYRQYAMWKVRVFQKHRGAVRPRHLVPPVFVAGLVGGAALGVVASWAWLPWMAGVAAYAAVVGIATSRRPDRTVSEGRFAAAIVTLHLAYGVGFWQGLLRFAPRWIRDESSMPERLAPRSAEVNA